LVGPHCQADTRFQGYRPRTVLTLTGALTLHRAYYHCDACGRGHVPLDGQLGLTGHRLSPALEPLVSLAGTLVPFAKTEDLRRRLAGLRLSDSTTRRVTEEAGAALAAPQCQGHVPGPPAGEPWDFRLPERDGRRLAGTVAYLGLDAFAVPTRPPGGRGLEWRMLYVGLLYTPDKRHTAYLTGLDFEQVAAQLRSYAAAFGLGRAETLVAVTDGGNGLERVLRQAFHEGVEFVLDWSHVAEKLHALAGLWHNRDPAAARAWAERAKDLLWGRGGQALLEDLRAQVLPEGASAELAEGYRQLCGYVKSNVHRLDYPGYRAKGWEVGSGPTEAGCKVMSGRLKGTGMRWCVSQTEPVAALRALYASEESLWDAFWRQRRSSHLQK
jgi:hypothetical protein